MTTSPLPEPVRQAVAHVARLAAGPPLDRTLRVTCSFHPDRFAGPGTTESVIERLVASGSYVSQFVTGTSNGGLTAYRGGDRFRWESALFGGMYDDADPDLRPKYGALNHRRRGTGASPRFGSAHLRLAEHTLERSTFCFPDSFDEPADFGVAASCDLADRADRSGRDLLDDYVEAQVHGHLDLRADVEAVVLDPSFRGTAVEEAARELPCPVEWHDGFVAQLADIEQHPDYRGPEIVQLARRYAHDGVLDPRTVGEVASLGIHEPQAVKQLWHYTARFGTPEARSRPPARD
ncbi:DUF3626 domain-containing protein [Flexivirga sp. ID2601S]|uniref:DUF3626 domain-containing protein n=1 Tax=Flexivirga aerilata TaxID=1656889 RepID=A0A849AW76_9MICO|nr:DUF3626 domain-containing protein [Flexivirga aerilata]NNG40922.1 DUF3626 domain-containing protein [Flexivirga aerilata]